ncbi:hypothetical protein [Kiloniella sp. EL199]|uniref:hypothetical protein n=1 Tax=Kiloniella sp. EL199 TaxID=2107581 RepID=UPI0013C49CCB|nr:hypothetical protein [Kiloniella sp. EL199]
MLQIIIYKVVTNNNLGAHIGSLVSQQESENVARELLDGTASSETVDRVLDAVEDARNNNRSAAAGALADFVKLGVPILQGVPGATSSGNDPEKAQKDLNNLLQYIKKEGKTLQGLLKDFLNKKVNALNTGVTADNLKNTLEIELPKRTQLQSVDVIETNITEALSGWYAKVNNTLQLSEKALIDSAETKQFEDT